MNQVLHGAEVRTGGIRRVLCRQERDLLTAENHQEFTRKLSNLISAQQNNPSERHVSIPFQKMQMKYHPVEKFKLYHSPCLTPVTGTPLL